MEHGLAGVAHYSHLFLNIWLGCIAELVGKWLTSIGVDPKLLEDESEVIKKEFVPEPEVGDKKPKKSKVDSQEKIPVTQEDTCSISGAIEALQLDKDLSSVLG